MCFFIFWLLFFSTLLVFFFFQAEDGIRDIGVTGVQTCALPISGRGDAFDGIWAGFGRWIGRGGLAEGLRSPSVRPVRWAPVPDRVIWADFAARGHRRGRRRRVCGARLSFGRESMTCRRAGVWGSRACRATLPFEGLIYARSAVTLAPAFFAAACQSAT